MKRILQIIDSMNIGGAQVLLMNIYRRINRDKIQFDFLLNTEKECFYNDEIKKLGGVIYTVSPRNKGIKKNKKDLIKFFKEHHNEYSIVHQHVSSLSYVEPLKIASEFKIPCRIIHGHSTQQGGSKLHIFLHYYNQQKIKYYATDFFACSFNVAMWLSKKKSDQFKIIKNGIETKKYKYSPEIRKKVRSELKIAEDTFVIGHVGRFTKAKNHQFLLTVFYELSQKYENAILLLVGNGELYQNIYKKAKELKIDKKIIFMGEQEDTSVFYQIFDFFVFPSLYEGLGISIIEAQCSGLKCFVSKDRVPDEVKITDLVKFIPIDSGTQIWTDEMLIQMHNKYKRMDKSIDIKKAQYDIEDIAKKLQKFYLSKK